MRLSACECACIYVATSLVILEAVQIDMDELRNILTDLDGKAPLPKDLLWVVLYVWEPLLPDAADFPLQRFAIAVTGAPSEHVSD